MIQRALGSLIPRVAANESTKAAILSCASTPPRRIGLTHAADLLTSYVDRKPRSTSASRKLSCPSAYPETGTHLCADPFEPASRKLCPALGMSRPGVWLPTWRVFKPLLPWRPISAPNAHGLHSSEPCLLPGDRIDVPAVLSAPALSHKTSRPCAGASAAYSHLEKPSPFVLPRGLVRAGGICSPEYFDLSGSPTTDPHREASPLPIPLFVLEFRQSCDHRTCGP